MSTCNIFFMCLLIEIIPCSTFLVITMTKTVRNKSTNETTKEKKSENVDISIMMELDVLEKHVKEMTIPESNKEKILRVIDFEKEYIKYSIISDLGKAEYEKLR